MNDNMAWRHSTQVVGFALAVSVVFEMIVLSSSLKGAVRYGLSGAIAVAMVLGVAQLSINRRES